ncbi:unnamed protein product [Vicia faba]|uniref:Uncharacterized protein n=1 Tax=Vicia faba TaxID=3906 RepID=A0AAV0Z838_VICFA|nr:unnamed protein product [Vicia faba]
MIFFPLTFILHVYSKQHFLFPLSLFTSSSPILGSIIFISNQIFLTEPPCRNYHAAAVVFFSVKMRGKIDKGEKVYGESVPPLFGSFIKVKEGLLFFVGSTLKILSSQFWMESCMLPLL